MGSEIDDMFDDILGDAGGDYDDDGGDGGGGGGDGGGGGGDGDDFDDEDFDVDVDVDVDDDDDVGGGGDKRGGAPPPAIDDDEEFYDDDDAAYDDDGGGDDEPAAAASGGSKSAPASTPAPSTTAKSAASAGGSERKDSSAAQPNEKPKTVLERLKERNQRLATVKAKKPPPEPEPEPLYSLAYKAIRGRVYLGPDIDTEEPPPDLERNPGGPMYLGPDGQFYDAYYRLIDPKGPGRETFLRIQKHLLKNFPEFPLDDQFDTLADYEAAVLDWKAETGLIFGQLKLPVVIGRYYYRPRTAKVAEPKPDDDPDAPPPADDDEAAFDALELPYDPWDTQLIWREPSPTNYRTYEDYEKAYRHWSFLVLSKTFQIPPHPSDYRELLFLTSSKPEKHSDSSRRGGYHGKNDEAMMQNLRGVGHVQRFQLPTDELYRMWREQCTTLPSVDVDLVYELGDEWSYLDDDVRGSLTHVVTTIAANRSHQYLMTKAYTAPVLPVEHGILQTWGQKSQERKKFLEACTNTHLRRTDVRPEQYCYDCPAEIDGMKVVFEVARHDVIEVQLKRLADNDERYRDELRNARLKELHWDGRNDHMNAWYHPKIRKQVHMMHRKEISNIMAEDDHIDASTVERILMTPMYLDKFMDMLSESESVDDYDEGANTYMQSFLSAITPVSLPELLQIYDNSNSPIIHAKLANLVQLALQNQGGKAIVEYLIDIKDVASLHHLARSMAGYSEIPYDVWPYSATTQQLLFETFGEQIDVLFTDLLVFYYLSTIHKKTKENTFLYIAVNQVVGETLQTVAENLSDQICGSSTFLEKEMFRGLGSRSQVLSSYFLFCLVQLLRNAPGEVQRKLGSDEVGLVHQVRALCQSKFTHAQFAASHLFRILQEPTWQALLYSTYRKDPYLLDEDLLRCPNALGRCPTIAERSLEMCVNVCRQINATNLDKYMFLFGEHRDSIFARVLDFVMTFKPLNPTSVNLSSFMSAYARVCFKLDMMNAIDSDAKRARGLKINVTLLAKITDFVQEVSGGDEQSYMVKTNVLHSIRHILKNASSFELFVRTPNAQAFCSKLVSFCRDGANKEFNRCAWKLYYQMIKFHSNGMQVLGANHNKLLDIIGTSAGNTVIMNSLNYIAKLLLLNSVEQRRLTLAGQTARREKDIKSLQRDLNVVISYFQQKFIMVHMIYKRLGDSASGIPGAPFLALARFYNVVGTEPLCKPFAKDIVKNDTYKDGIEHMQKMYNFRYPNLLKA